MGTIIWLCVTTLVGALIGHIGHDALAMGAFVGFILGLIIRFCVEILGDVDL